MVRVLQKYLSMSRNSSHDLHELALRVAAQHRAAARACERMWLDELDRRRRELATECNKLLHVG